jgi:hypothetical protein
VPGAPGTPGARLYLIKLDASGSTSTKSERAGARYLTAVPVIREVVSPS